QRPDTAARSDAGRSEPCARGNRHHRRGTRCGSAGGEEGDGGGRLGAWTARRAVGPAVKTSPARRAAYDVLHEVGARSAYANLALASRLANDSMSRPDRGLATDLVYTTLRRRMTL